MTNISLDEVKEIFKSVEEKDDVVKIIYEDNKVMVLTEYRSYAHNFVSEISKIVAEESEIRFGLKVWSGGEKLNNKRVLSFIPQSKDPNEVFCMYGAISDIDPIILTDITEQIDSSTSLEVVAEDIVNISSSQSDYNKDELHEFMNIE